MDIPDKYTYPILALVFLLVAALFVYAGETGTAASIRGMSTVCPAGYVEVPITGYSTNGGYINATTCAPAVKP